MLILALRTDNPQAEIGLFNDSTQITNHVWQAHRQLAETLHTEIEKLLTAQQKTWQDIEGIVVYAGPGSFTGLRIGLSVANALAYSLQVPIAGQMSKNWLSEGLQRLISGDNDKQVLPEYGAEAHITQQRK